MSGIKLRIKRRTTEQWLAWLIIIIPFVLFALIQGLSFPNFTKYSIDLILVITFAFLFRYRIKKKQRSNFLLLYVLVFLMYTLVAYFWNYHSIMYYLWGLRNNFRFYLAFFAFVIFFSKEEIDDFLSLFDKIFWFNTAVCLVQYFLLGYKQDYLGGVFGIKTGGNSYLNIFFCIIVIKSLVFCFNKSEAVWYCVLKCGVTLALAAMAEIKFYYIEFIVIVLLTVLLTSFSWRKLVIVILAAVGVVLGIRLLILLFPNYMSFFALDILFDAGSATSGYTGTGDINRLTAIDMVSSRFLTTPTQKIVGMGLGNCDSSAFDFLNTSFYELYSWTHYHWLSTAFIFLETGYVGFSFYFGFFVLIFVFASIIERRSQGCRIYSQITKIMSIVCILIAIYNSSLRTEAAFMAYFILALPFAYEHSVSGGLI